MKYGETAYKGVILSLLQSTCAPIILGHVIIKQTQRTEHQMSALWPV